MNLPAHTLAVATFTQRMREARRDSLALLIVELSGATLSVSCREWIKKNYAHSWPLEDEKIVAKLETWRRALNLDSEKYEQLTVHNFLLEDNRRRGILFLADEAALVIDPFGYDGWELFFQMLESWQGELKELPTVVSSILGRGQ